MSETFLEAGWFLVEDNDNTRWPGPPAPRGPVTVSSCVLDIWPDAWALTWVESDAQQLAAARAALALDEPTFAELRAWTTRALEDGRYGWPDVFLDLETAREFHRRFLRSARPVRLVGIALEAGSVDEFLRDAWQRTEREAPNGAWVALARRRPLVDPGTLLGFDVLGPDTGGIFHRYSCYDLHAGYVADLGIDVNEHGLIRDHATALRAREHTLRGGQTPVNWYPFRVAEYVLTP